MPTAAHVLPPEMRVVSSGLTLCLWGVVLALLAVLGVFLVPKIGGNPGGMQNAEQAGSIVLIFGLMMFVSNVLRVIGLWKCTKSPIETGAKGLATVAFTTAIIGMICDISNALVTQGILPPSVALILGLALVGGICGVVTLISFVLFLRKTADYLQDGLLLEKAKGLVTLTYVFAATIGIIILIPILAVYKIAPAVLGIIMLAAR